MAIGGIAGVAVSGGLWTYAYFSDISPYNGKAVTVYDTNGMAMFGTRRAATSAAQHIRKAIGGPRQREVRKACSGYKITRSRSRHVPLGVMRPVAVYRYRYVIRPRSRS